MNYYIRETKILFIKFLSFEKKSLKTKRKPEYGIRRAQSQQVIDKDGITFEVIHRISIKLVYHLYRKID